MSAQQFRVTGLSSPLAFPFPACVVCCCWLVRDRLSYREAAERRSNRTNLPIRANFPQQLNKKKKYKCHLSSRSTMMRLRMTASPYTPADRCSTYRKYVPAAYARKLNKPNTPAAMLEPRPRPYKFDQEASCTMNAMK